MANQKSKLMDVLGLVNAAFHMHLLTAEEKNVILTAIKNNTCSVELGSLLSAKLRMYSGNALMEGIALYFKETFGASRVFPREAGMFGTEGEKNEELQ